MNEHFEGGTITPVHLWTLICLSLGVLGENERTYLGPDLAEVGLSSADRPGSACALPDRRNYDRCQKKTL